MPKGSRGPTGWSTKSGGADAGHTSLRSGDLELRTPGIDTKTGEPDRFDFKRADPAPFAELRELTRRCVGPSRS
jgi:hypothetical protein